MDNDNNNQSKKHEIYTVETQYIGEKTVNEIFKEFIISENQLTKNKEKSKISL